MVDSNLGGQNLSWQKKDQLPLGYFANLSYLKSKKWSMKKEIDLISK